MDPRVARITTPADCEQFIINVKEKYPDLVVEARQRAIELRACQHRATSDVEREALQAVYAYEEVLADKNGKKTPASRTWQMIKRRGLVPAVERAVTRPKPTVGYRSLERMGLLKYAFEAVVLRHPSNFSTEAIRISTERLKDVNIR